MTYFWSDLHLNHRGILNFTLRDGTYSRPYKDIYEMNTALTEKWNATVLRESDDVWVLGDFAFHHQAADDIHVLFHRLRGKKSLIVGNHDEKNPAVLRLPWERVEKLHTFKSSSRRAELCHYPLETWKGSHSGALMLHGHCHGSLKRKLPKRFDLGVDTLLGEAGPVSWETLCDLAIKENYFIPTDAHGERTQVDM